MILYIKKGNRFHLVLIAFALSFLFFSCTKDYLVKPVPPMPKVGVETDSLVAAYVAFDITSINDAYWKEADFHVVESIENLNVNQIYAEDGRLNLTGTYAGISDYNNGTPTTVTLKAAYDEEYVYILAEWEDMTVNVSWQDWLWNGPADPLKTDSTSGWTSQRNNDKISFAFDIDGAMSNGQSFSTSGCAASCHNGGSGFEMAPESGNVDIWNWSAALSDPFGYGIDMNTSNGSGLANDQGNQWFHRNSADPNDYRSGPAFEWDGAAQNVTQSLGSPTILDPAWFILNKTAFTGNATTGAMLYKNSTKGCESCHGEEGKGFGPNGDGPPFNDEVFSRKFSRETFKEYSSSNDHSGKGYYDGLSASQADNLIAYIRGLAGVPGYYLEEPADGESITDLKSHSNVNAARINTEDVHSAYKVMFKRKLDTGNMDDVKFEPDQQSTYVFGLALMDNDGNNHVGSLLNHLTFKEK